MLDYCDIKKIGENACYFGWDNHKWYDGFEGYEDVNAIEDGLDYLEEQDLSYRFAKMGEESTDYSERYYDGESDVVPSDCIPYPWLNRCFDDSYIEQEIIKSHDKRKEDLDANTI